MSKSSVSRFGAVPALLGLIVVGTYLTSSLGYFPGPDKLLLILFFAIGPVAIIGTLAIRRRLVAGAGAGRELGRDATAAAGGSLWADVGAVFLVIGFAFMNLMLVVQQFVRLRVREELAASGAEALGELAREELRGILRVVDLVQQGIDVSFDIFYCAGLLLISAAMVRHPDFGKLLGYFGMISSAALLALNLGAFPHIPGETGLVDLGPLTGFWWLAVIIQLTRLDRRDKKTAEGVT